MPCERAISSLIVPRPLEPAITVANPTRYCVSRRAFHSDAEKSFFVTMLMLDAPWHGAGFLFPVQILCASVIGNASPLIESCSEAKHEPYYGRTHRRAAAQEEALEAVVVPAPCGASRFIVCCLHVGHAALRLFFGRSRRIP